jgi:hypothetical protein
MTIALVHLESLFRLTCMAFGATSIYIVTNLDSQEYAENNYQQYAQHSMKAEQEV